MAKSIRMASKTTHREIKQYFCDFRSSLLRMVSCSSLCSLVWDHILKHQFERIAYTAPHFATWSGILTLEFCSSWSEAYPTSPFFKGWYSIKLCHFRQENISCNSSYFRVYAQNVILLFCQVIYPIYQKYWTKPNKLQQNCVSRTKC